MREITHIVIHYSATYEDQNITAADINRMHLQRGFDKIGYHYFIRRDGTLEKGREEWEVGAHVSGHNSNTIGVCWSGGLNRATGANKGVNNRTEAQTATLIKIVKELLVRYPNAKVIGHRDMPNAKTQCPGENIADWWKGVQQTTKIVVDKPDLFNVTKAYEVENLVAQFKSDLMKIVRGSND